MDGDLGDLGVLLKAAFVAGVEAHWEITLADGTVWIVSTKPVKS
jgi:hypothetical protein